VAMVTGLTLELHLASHKATDSHTSSQCSICQQLLITPGKFILESQFRFPSTEPFKYVIEFAPQSYIATLHHQPFSPRPPPHSPA
jgi:hypothetical protein